MKDEAVTAIEYTLIALLIFVVIVEAVQLLGDKVLLLYDTVASVFPS
jgi:Flp pilus assembly pilin Flp